MTLHDLLVIEIGFQLADTLLLWRLVLTILPLSFALFELVHNFLRVIVD